jgi:hypothetical protein
MKKTALDSIYKAIESKSIMDFMVWLDKNQAKLRMLEKLQMKDCFEQSRLTHPMVGFKFDTFEDYFNQKFKEDKK